MFSTTHEIASSAPSYVARPKQPHSAPAPSDDFAAMIDSAAPATPADTRSVPQPAQPPQRSDNTTRDTAPQDAPGATQATSTPKDAKDAPVTSGKTTDQPGKTAADSQGPTKGNGTGKVSSDGKKDGDQTKDGGTDVSATAPTVVPVDPNAAAAVAVVVPVATAPASSPTGNVQAAIGAVTETAATTAAQTAGKADPSAAVDTSDAGQNAPSSTETDPKLATVSAADVTKLSTSGAAEVTTAAIATATTAQQPQGAGKTKTAEPSAKTGASSKGGDKQVIESSTASAPAQQTAETAKVQKTGSDADAGTEKPVTEKSGTEKSATDKAKTKQDAATTSADDVDTSQAGKASPPPTAAEHRPSTAAPTVQPLQPDLSLLAANNQPQPLQLNVPNVAAAPAPQLTATVLAGDAPVPLDGLAADIALRAAGGNSRFEIRLDPAELGRIDVRLDVDKHGQVTSHLTVERPATLDMLRRDAPQLQQALEDAGLKTGDSGLQFSLRDQSSSGQQNDNGSGRQSQRLVITEENAAPAQAAGRNYGRMLGTSGGVDIRV